MNKTDTTWIPLTKIGDFLGYPIHPATFHRWRQKGVEHHGRKVKLPCRKIGSRFFTREDDLLLFIEQLNDRTENNAPSSGGMVTNPNDIDAMLDELGV